MRTENNKGTSILGRIRGRPPHTRVRGCGAAGPASGPSDQPPGEGTGGASGAAAPFGEAGVSAGGSGLAGV